MDLDRFARVELGHWPTPLTPCHRLRDERSGPLVWLKRDDCSGLALGGNKTRKLEFLVGAAQAAGASGIVTFGALQSNHARQTAAACNVVGLPCDLILTDQVQRGSEHYRRSGNRLLDEVLGATVHVVADVDEALVRAGELLEGDGDRVVIDPGGSTPVGTLGYVAMVAELASQLDEASVAPDHVVTAASTGGTAAGIVVGGGLSGLDLTVVAAAVYETADATRASIERLVGDTALLFDEPLDGAVTLDVDDSMLGDGYGIPSQASRTAIEVLARTEGVLLDPVYTAKAFALVLDRLDQWDPHGDVVFVHTGGHPGLFAYADEWAGAD